jgi:hypothetical protein
MGPGLMAGAIRARRSDPDLTRQIRPGTGGRARPGDAAVGTGPGPRVRPPRSGRRRARGCQIRSAGAAATGAGCGRRGQAGGVRSGCQVGVSGRGCQVFAAPGFLTAYWRRPLRPVSGSADRGSLAPRRRGHPGVSAGVSGFPDPPGPGDRCRRRVGWVSGLPAVRQT